MGWQSSIFPLLIVVSGQPNTGFFVYSGPPGPGNPPQIAIVATGVTTDPFGNPLSAADILLQGNIITEADGIFRTSATAPLIQLDGPHDALLVYDAAGHLVDTIAPVATSDGLGNTVRAGITTYQPGVSFAELITGALSLGLTGATPSVIAALVQVALNSAGQSLQLNSGTVGSDTPSQLILNDSAVTAAGIGGGPGLHVVDALDGNTYDTERLTLISPGATINSAVTPVTVFSATFNNQGVAGSQGIEMKMTLTVTVAGTLLLTGLELVAGNTVTVSQGSTLTIEPVVAT
jgi:hypothetical protein